MLLAATALTLRAESTPTPATPSFTFSELGKAVRDTELEGHYTYPPGLTAANNKPVTVGGFMVPYDSLEDMRVFMLMASSGGCFFCEPPSLNQVVIVRQKKGASKAFIEDPIQVTGTLRLNFTTSTHPDHQAGFVYVLEDATVEKKAWPNGKPQARPAMGEHSAGVGK